MDRRRLVIFDVDGTLFQTDCVTVPAVQRTFAAHGMPPPDREAILGFFGRSVAAYEEWLAAQCAPEEAAKIVAETNTLELQLIAEEGRLYTGAKETVENLCAQDCLLAICSNGPEAYVDAVLDAHGLRPYFPVVYARGGRYSGKEEMVGLILKELLPDSFAVIGDRHDDIEAAHAWNGYGIAALYGFGNDTEWEGADARINTVAEACACLETLFSQ